MKIAILSDIHDQKANFDLVLNQIKEQGISQAIILGDFCAPPTVMQLVKSGISCRCIFGNNDGDRARMKEVASGSKIVFSQQEYDSYEIDGRKVFATHYPEIAQPIAASGQFDAVFYGHDHQRSLDKLENGTLLVNPGEIWGWLNGVVSYAIWDTSTNNAEILEIIEMEK